MMRQRYILFLFGTTTLIGAMVYMEGYVNIQEITHRGFEKSSIQMAEEANEKRKSSIQKFCKLNKFPPLNVTIASWSRRYAIVRPRLYFSDAMKLILCETPKCGTTQWRNLMLIMDGHLEGYEAGPEDNIVLSKSHNFMWTKFDLENQTHVNNISERLRQYFKIMTTRDPLERLVSAYRDKLETDRDPYYYNVSKRIHKSANPESPPGLASFNEFIDYILSTENRRWLDPHWKPYSELCDPCNIDYDHIARMETLYDDAEVITRNIAIARDRIYNATGREGLQERRNELFHEYFLRLPIAKRDAIFRYYKDQYDMFDYDYPDFISDSNFHSNE